MPALAVLVRSDDKLDGNVNPRLWEAHQSGQEPRRATLASTDGKLPGTAKRARPRMKSLHGLAQVGPSGPNETRVKSLRLCRLNRLQSSCLIEREIKLTLTEIIIRQTR
jgi:hypothetical protein